MTFTGRFCRGRCLHRPAGDNARPYKPFGIINQKIRSLFVGCGFLFSGKAAYRKMYFRMNSTVRTYISGVIFFSLALPVRTLISVQEMMPMAIPSEML